MTTPQWKLYRDGKYVAALKYAEDAAILVAATGGVVKHNHGVTVWAEGSEEFPAGESYDRAAEIMETRRYNYVKNSLERIRKQSEKAEAEIKAAKTTIYVDTSGPRNKIVDGEIK